MKFLYKPLPKDFNCEDYRIMNPDLKNLSNVRCKIHYILYGQSENRTYINKLKNLPEDFDSALYKYYNPDLKDCPDEWVKMHYVEHGIKENRVYKASLPNDFDPIQYIFFNRDLRSFCVPRLKAHYSSGGKQENRKYKDDLFDENFFIKHNLIENYVDYSTYTADISQIKSQKLLDLISNIPTEHSSNCILLVGHLATLQGATNQLYNFYNYIKPLTSKHVYVADSNYNEDILKKYNIEKADFISYEKDSTLLYNICKTLNPSKVLFNCLNGQYIDVIKALNLQYAIYSHEVKEDFVCFEEFATPTYVVSNRIKEQYNLDYSIAPFVQPPVMTSESLNIIDQEKIKIPEEIKNHSNILNLQKITIGMCGGTNDRKGYKIFKELATQFLNYNFLWIGGHFDITDESISNFYQIKEILLPFKYFSLIDYFLLTSLSEPSPGVVLENLYVGNTVITFKHNIYTDYKCSQLKDLYFEFDESISVESAAAALNLWVSPDKKPAKKEEGANFVRDKFTRYTDAFLKHVIT